ncbi:MAG TPA: transcription elongation factor GreA [Nitrospirae bacterium]|nr:transcription elongation factor GreA [bacterium BMS3Abin10]GBE38185.1 transcription elongation factor GreA [bacterium BMS3Bbin08]HDK16765.1 transcription elongation factor GreA [Nitrospirota bacterium]HDZ84828.1 transcription elongation factor GreA [Nitrospirota bacterium]
MQKLPITPSGYKKLQAEFAKLLKAERPQNIKAIAEARSHGDLSENAEYHAAKERQSFIEGRIQELQTKLATLQVIDPSRISHDKVAFGAKIKVLNLDTDEEKTFTLVGPDESDVKNNKLSIMSPVGRSLIGKSIGDLVTVKAPAKTMEYEILDLSFE